MRVLAIGLGGAGSRIVDKLYDHDSRSGVGCMHALAIDTDVNTLLQLKYLPDTAKFHFPSLDPDQHYDTASTIDIEQIMTAIQRMDTVEIDAIMFFCGLGGHMAEAVRIIVPEIRKSFIEPVFAVVTLPCLGEGGARSAKAALDIDMIGPFFDAVILFDNETWYKKLRERFSAEAEERLHKRRLRRAPAAPTNPRDVYRLLNERIARQVGLLLRAGEFNEDGLEVAEVVLDAGEILNTLKGNGMVAIGYAAEPLPSSWFDVFDRWRSARHFFEGAHRRAARIVSLAKQAVYEDISIPCDLTSAERALVLIAGPSKELSMKGFQTVRKWIDRSIAGLEMRSGDYPVKNTGYVGIIIMLAGLENIPRLSEIREIRETWLLEEEAERRRREEELASREGEEEGMPSSEAAVGHIPEEEVPAVPPKIGETPQDEMIAVPAVKKGREREPGVASESIPAPPRTQRQDDALILPRRPGRTELDMTRQTSGGDRMKPKNDAFSARDIHAGAGPAAPRLRDETPVRVRTLPKAKDGIIDAEKVSVTPAPARPKEAIIDAERVSVAKTGKKIRELVDDSETVKMRDRPTGSINNTLRHAEKSLEQSVKRPKETDPGKRRIKIIPAEEQEEAPAGDERDDDLFWIT
ncbi:MAG: cell division protein [Methanomicrobiales archaeon]|nr:cell division protein [Methanomicrobiales archaeon]